MAPDVSTTAATATATLPASSTATPLSPPAEQKLNPDPDVAFDTAQAPAKRKRPAACVHCHQRKVRCDARIVGIPCSNCRSAHKDDCRIHEKKKRIPVRSVLNPVPIRSAPPVPPSSSSSTCHSVIAAAAAPSSLPAKLLPQKPATAAQNGGGTRHYHSHSQPIFHKVDDSDEGLHETTARDELGTRLIKIIDQEDQNGPAIQQGIRVIYVGQDMSNMNFLLRQQQLSEVWNEDIHHFPASETPRQYHRKAFDQIPRDALELPPQPLADELVDAYFTHINPGCPIVEEDVFMSQYRHLETASPSLLLLQAIFLVGAHVCKPRPERDALKDTFYRRAKTLFEARVERNRDCMVQAALLLTWYSDPLDDDVTANAHHWVGVAARIATGIGMHRNTASTRMVHSEKRMWRRVFWILYGFDVMVSLMHGRPQAINLEDCDVLPLSAADFEGCGARVQVDFMIHLATLCTSISSIIRERFGLHVSAERRKLALLQADKALAHWSSMLPPHLCMTSNVNHSPDCWAAKLHLVYHNLLILLHRPHPRADDYGPNDAEICIAAAGVIVATMEDLRQKDQLKYLWVSSVNAMFTAMIQVRVELCFSNALLAMNALGRFNSAATSLKVLGEYWIIAETLTRIFLNSKRLQRDLQALRHDTKNDHFNNAEKGLEFACGNTLNDTVKSDPGVDDGQVIASLQAPPPPPANDPDPWSSQKLPFRPHYPTAAIANTTTLEGPSVIADGGGGGGGPQPQQAPLNTATHLMVDVLLQMGCNAVMSDFR
ncbi:hypothetical protein KEM56_002019 [Ascosphaera pollenicola]|nr:hypothetical protein KEM56_002019 [Ascosphaera pollenicola]